MFRLDPLSDTLLRTRAAVKSRRLPALLALALLASLLCLSAVAQDADEISERLDGRFDVFELRDGWLLQPTGARGDFRAIEVRDGRVAVDGESVDEEELRRFVDADAEIIFALAEGRSIAPPAPPEPPRLAQEEVRDEELDEDRERQREETVERLRQQLEEAIREARRGVRDREALDELRRLEQLEEPPRELERLVRELERVIERAERVGSRRSRDTQVTLGSNLVVEEDERVSDVVVIGGNLDVYGDVDGDTTVVLGNAHVRGYIDGSLVVVGGDIDVASGGGIDGDAIAVGGAVHTESGGHIDGEIVHLDFGELMRMNNVHIGNFRWPHMEMFHWFDFGFLEVIGRIFRIFFLAVLALLVYVLAGAKVEEVSTWVRGAPWRSLFSGVAVEIAFFPAMLVVIVLLMVSIIGILVACLVPPLAIFVLLVVSLLGYTAVALCLGDWVVARFGLHAGNRYLVILLGMAVIEVWSVIGDALGIIRWLGWIGALILFVAWCFKFLVWTTGLGAAVLCQFSSHPTPTDPSTSWAAAPRPMPPPVPGGAGAGDEDVDDESWDEERDYPLLQSDDIVDEGEPDGESNPP